MAHLFLRSTFSRVASLAAPVRSVKTSFSPAVSCASLRSFHSSSPCRSEEKEYSETVQKLADEICSLSVLEVANLTDLLKTKLNISDAMLAPAAAAAPAAAGAAAPAAEEEAPAEQTAFTVKLESFDAANKIKVIKEVRGILGLGLKESKDLVEGAPALLKSDVTKEEAEKIQAALKEVGGVVNIS